LSVHQFGKLKGHRLKEPLSSPLCIPFFNNSRKTGILQRK